MTTRLSLARRSTTLVVAFLVATAACRSRVRFNDASVTIVGLPAVAIDPYLHSHLPTWAALSNFYEGLVTLDPSSAVVPQLATVWENPSDTVWRLHLRHPVVFHDGRPFGAADVVASFERARRLPRSEVVDAVKEIASVRALDEHTVEITTDRPTATLLAQLAYVAIVPRGEPLTPITRPVGTGPYRFVLGRPYGEFEGERFGQYWGPRPIFRHYRYVPIEGPVQEGRWIEQRRADVAVFVSRSIAAASRASGFRVIRGRPMINFLLGLVRRPDSPFSDVRCRRAAAMAIDRNLLAHCDADRILSPLDALIPPGVFGSVAASAGPPDPAGGRRLLAESGHPKGLDVSCLLYEGDLAIGRELARELSAAGIRLSLRSLPRRDYFPALSDRKDALFLFNWVPEWGDAAQLLDGFLHSRSGNYGEHNFIASADPELDRRIERADSLLDPSARIVALADAVRYAQDDLPLIPLAVETRLTALRADLDFTPRADGILRAFDLRVRR